MENCAESGDGALLEWTYKYKRFHDYKKTLTHTRPDNALLSLERHHAGGTRGRLSPPPLRRPGCHSRIVKLRKGELQGQIGSETRDGPLVCLVCIYSQQVLIGVA